MVSVSQILQHKKLVLIGGLGLLILLLVLGCLFFPTVFYDNFIWKYFWGPVVADGLEQPVSHNGVMAAEKFTLVSEIVYGCMVLGGLASLLYLLNKWKIKIDTNFFIAIFPYILYGTVVRVLEDAEFFAEPFVFWFVTPLVYFQALFIILLFTFIGVILEKKITHRYITVKKIIFYSGICLVLPFIYYMISWMAGNQWSISNGVRYDVFFVVSIILAIIILIIFGITRALKENPSIRIYGTILNLSMIVGHMLDGITSWISIYDPFQMGLPVYVEKHPASDMLMQLWPPLFPIVKFILIVVVIYVFDVLYKKDLEEYPMMKNLLKIGIFILGFAPGLRDLLRVSMGV
jgi:uncharacterized membrane protein